MREHPRAIANDLRRFERLCLLQTNLCTLAESRAALRTMSGNYATVAQAIERPNGFANTVPTQQFFRGRADFS